MENYYSSKNSDPVQTTRTCMMHQSDICVERPQDLHAVAKYFCL